MKYQNISKLLFLILVALVALSVTSCKDDEEGMGTPQITAVRSCDPAKADSTFTKAGPGSLIAVVGNNLSDVQKAFINDQQVYFNPTMNTDHSVIITVPTEDDGFVLTAFDSNLKDEIRLETSHGTATYAFKITAPWPAIQRIQGAYPRKGGDILNVYGMNLVDIERVYLTDIPAEQLDTTVWESVGGNQVDVQSYEVVVSDHHRNAKTNAYETTSQLKVTLPDFSFANGALVIQTATGSTYIPFSELPGLPVLLDLSTDFPVPGEVVTITGREFIQVSAVSFGGITVTPDQFTVSDEEDEITFIMPQVPARGSEPFLTVTTPGGSSSVRFCDYGSLLTNFDDDATDNGWGPNAIYEEAEDEEEPPYTSDGVYARIFVGTEAQQWWGTMIYFRKDWDGNKFPLPSFDVIPADASTDDVYLAMEVFNNNSSYNDGVFTGYLRYLLQADAEDPVGKNNDSGQPNPVETVNQFDSFEWEDYPNTFINTRTILGDIDGNAPVGRWYRHVVPLSAFLKYQGKTYQDVVADGINQFRIQSINQGTARGHIDVCFDNVRIIYKKK